VPPVEEAERGGYKADAKVLLDLSDSLADRPAPPGLQRIVAEEVGLELGGELGGSSLWVEGQGVRNTPFKSAIMA
jgi:hypothetical protein